MRKGYVFDRATGTMVPSGRPAPLPSLSPSPAPPAPQGARPVRLSRSQGPTPLVLVGEGGALESYLDSEGGVLMFREREDCDVWQVADERSGKVLAQLSGYALSLHLDPRELGTPERVEQLASGLAKLAMERLARGGGY